MKNIFKIIMKYLFLFIFGGILYILFEIGFRGYSHWTMFILGGICFIAIGSINNFLSWKTPLITQSIIGGVIITILEYITGCIVNIQLGWNIWDYSDKILNIRGQICLPFCIIWVAIAALAIVVDDYLRYWIFKERKPHYEIV